MLRVLSLGISLMLVAVAGPAVFVAAQDQSSAASAQSAPPEAAQTESGAAEQEQAEAAPDTAPQTVPLPPGDVLAPSASTAAEPPVLVGKAGTNLQALPIDTKMELMKVMDEFSKSLGVTCVFCHVLDDPQNGFARDDKKHKVIAREMIRMRDKVNKDFEPLLGPDSVSCFTCHRGSKHPEREIPTDADKKESAQ